MSFTFILWLILLALIGLVWVSRHGEIARARREQVPLTPDSDAGPPSPAPSVSVVVAAKDEAENIETCVQTLLDQDYPRAEYIVVNDRSHDDTGIILDRLAEGSDGRLRVLHVKQLRPGWFGKNNAMREGIALAQGEWICLSDADCRQLSRKTISIAVRHAVERGIDFLSVLPMLEMKTFWERVIQPVCAAVMLLWFHPRRVNDPQSKTAYANGAFMLMRRATYDAIGGHENVKSELNEDMHMARLAKAAGHRLCVTQNHGLYSVRMYGSLKAAWRGWSRIFYGCFGSVKRILISALVLSTVSVFPWVSLAFAFVGWMTAGTTGWGWGAALVSSLLVVVFQLSVIARFYALSRLNPWWAPTYILGAVICLGMLLTALRKALGGTTTWRGTTYQGDQIQICETAKPAIPASLQPDRAP